MNSDGKEIGNEGIGRGDAPRGEIELEGHEIQKRKMETGGWESRAKKLDGEELEGTMGVSKWGLESREGEGIP